MNEVFEIGNPSDPYTIQGLRAHCAVAVLMLGEGLYSLKMADGTVVLPICAFGGHEKALSALGVNDLEAWLEDPSNRAALAVVLDTVALQRERSSLNDIGAQARSMAESLRTWVPR